jgi:hypothetical protein
MKHSRKSTSVDQDSWNNITSNSILMTCRLARSLDIQKKLVYFHTNIIYTWELIYISICITTITRSVSSLVHIGRGRKGLYIQYRHVEPFLYIPLFFCFRKRFVINSKSIVEFQVQYDIFYLNVYFVLRFHTII